VSADEGSIELPLEDILAVVLMAHSEVLHKREFTCACGEFSTPLSDANARRDFYRHRGKMIVAMLTNIRDAQREATQ
jgi:hypothetical protein